MRLNPAVRKVSDTVTMRLFPLVSLILGLAACDAAGPGFSGAEKVIREQDGARFTLRRRGDLVEAIRTNPEVLPRFRSVAPKAGIAAQRWTGCRAAWVMGDPAMMVIGMDCAGRTPPKMPKRRHTMYCELFAGAGHSFEMDCHKT
ncbi:hypothetical protein ABFK29_00010 [Sagittula stellata E-37]